MAGSSRAQVFFVSVSGVVKQAWSVVVSPFGELGAVLARLAFVVVDVAVSAGGRVTGREGQHEGVTLSGTQGTKKGTCTLLGAMQR